MKNTFNNAQFKTKKELLILSPRKILIVNAWNIFFCISICLCNNSDQSCRVDLMLAFHTIQQTSTNFKIGKSNYDFR